MTPEAKALIADLYGVSKGSIPDKCHDHDCEQDISGEVIHWPGKGPIFYCRAHHEKATLILRTMGVLPALPPRFEDSIDIKCHGLVALKRGNMSLREAGASRTEVLYECVSCHKKIYVSDAGAYEASAEVNAAHDEVP